MASNTCVCFSMLDKERLSGPLVSSCRGSIDFFRLGIRPNCACLLDIDLSKEPATDVEPALPWRLPSSTDYTAVDPAAREPLSGTKLEETTIPLPLRSLGSIGKPRVDFFIPKPDIGSPRIPRALLCPSSYRLG